MCVRARVLYLVSHISICTAKSVYEYLADVRLFTYSDDTAKVSVSVPTTDAIFSLGSLQQKKSD